jgi:hypothetical protein
VSYTVDREEGETVGTYTITPSGDASQGNYSVTYNTGTFTITSRVIEITAASDSQVYNGLPLTADRFTVTTGSIADGQTASVILTGSQTFVGSSENVASDAVITITDGGADVTENYTITYVDGTLAVTANTTDVVTITAANATKVYDGTALTNARFTTSTLPAGVTSVTAVVAGTRTATGNSANTVTSYKLWNGTTDVTASFPTAKLTSGTLTITPRPITISVASATKVAGTADPTFTGSITAGTLVKANDLGTIGFFRSNAAVNAVGTYANVLSASYTSNANYAVTIVAGTFTITAAAAPVVINLTPPVVPLVAAPAVPAGPAPAAGPIVVVDNPTPLAPANDDSETIPEIPTPKSPAESAWALINLLLTILTGLLMISALVMIYRNKKNERIDAKYANGLRIFNIAAVIVAVVMFILTEDMTQPMQLTDKWTIWMAVIAIVEVIFTVVSALKHSEEEDDAQRA